MTDTGAQRNVLMVEDSPDDCELIAIELRRGGLRIDVTRLDTLPEVEQALDRGGWHLIISDYNLGAFTAADVLKLYHDRDLDFPFIVVSGAVGEEIAAQLMKAGAHDFFLKDRLQRLASAVEREMREAEIRREHRAFVARLQESEERFRAVANAAPVMIWGSTADSRRDYFNDPWLQFRGRTLQQEQGEGWFEGIHLDDLERVRALQKQCAARRKAYTTEYRLRRHDGEYRWVYERAIPRQAEGDGFLGFLGSCMDITEKKQTEENLVAAIKTRDEFLSAASHELQTPLTALTLHLAMLRRELESQGFVNEKVENRLESTDRAAMRLSKLVARLLDVTRITSGQLKLRPTQTDLRAVVNEVVTALREPLERSGSTLTVDAPEPVVGHWDPDQLDTVVSNLVSNAIKYGLGKPIRVRVENAGKVARLAVSDHGIGVAPEAQRKVFERFERGVSEMHYSGLGVGLWIVREVVAAHGGTVTLKSEPGKGATFVVELPLG